MFEMIAYHICNDFYIVIAGYLVNGKGKGFRSIPHKGKRPQGIICSLVVSGELVVNRLGA